METIVENIQGNIKIVQYNKPKRKNAIDKDMCLRVTLILQEAANDPDIDVLVLTGTGDYYSSGNDLAAASQTPRGAHLDILKKYIDAFITFPKILVAVVNGPAIGIAATTLALCDLVFAAEHVSTIIYFKICVLHLVFGINLSNRCMTCKHNKTDNICYHII